jgi:hypothetical protein
MHRPILAAVTFLALTMAGPAAAEELKVKVQGTDKAKFLQQMNENGKEVGLSFVEAETDYQYRVALYAEGATGSDFMFGGGADASAAVLTPDCEVAFILTRGGRSTKGGAMNALSKEIVKKLKALKK